MRNIVRASYLLAFLCTTTFLAQDWPHFRGTSAGVVADDPALPERWSDTENFLWKVDVPGLAWSSPIVWANHVFVTSAISADDRDKPPKGLPPATPARPTEAVYRWVVYDFDVATGQRRWERELHSGVPPITKQNKNSFSSETPVTDGERVYINWGTIGLLAALDMNGNMVWSTKVGTYRTNQGWGTAASPMLYKDRLYIVNDNREQSFLAAYDARTGREVWKTTRDEVENYSTPIIWENDLRTEIVTQGRLKFRSYSLDGKLLWELHGTSTSPISTPISHEGLLYLSSGFHQNASRPVYAIRPGAAGDITPTPGETNNKFIAWSQPTLASYQTSSLVYHGCLYTLIDNNFLLCHDPKTGTEIYGKQRIAADSSGFAASPWAYNGKVFALSEDGETFVIQAGRQFKVLGRNPLGDMALATPAIAHGSLFIRTQSRLYRIGTKQ